MSTKNTCYIYKNDLKFNDNIDINSSEFESDNVKSIYNNYKGKPKIELRMEDTKMENYKYLDLSKLDIDDHNLNELFKLDKIIKILERIEYLDLSANKLKRVPDLIKFKNIIFLNLAFNEITGTISDDNLIELTCDNNLIESIESKSISRLNASNNKIHHLNIPNISILIINVNKLNYLQSYLSLKYLECIDNNILSIDNFINLEELYIGNNKLNSIKNMPKLKVLNCINNPIQKIKYFENLKMLMTSVPNISSQYNIINISKIKKDYLINFKI